MGRRFVGIEYPLQLLEFVVLAFVPDGRSERVVDGVGELVVQFA
ncbi:hypothetical protein [Streptomyces sp. NPDC056549]